MTPTTPITAGPGANAAILEQEAQSWAAYYASLNATLMANYQAAFNAWLTGGQQFGPQQGPQPTPPTLYNFNVPQYETAIIFWSNTGGPASGVVCPQPASYITMFVAQALPIPPPAPPAPPPVSLVGPSENSGYFEVLNNGVLPNGTPLLNGQTYTDPTTGSEYMYIQVTGPIGGPERVFMQISKA